MRVISLNLILFPKLLTGPLIPFHEFIQLRRKWGVTAPRIPSGIQRFILGLSKKVLVAGILALAFGWSGYASRQAPSRAREVVQRPAGPSLNSPFLLAGGTILF